MSGARVRRRVEEEVRAEEAWSLQDYDWDPIACVARKKRILASGEGIFAANAGLSPLAHAFPDGAISGQLFQPTPAENPKFASMPVLEAVDRTDAEPATVCEVVGCGASLEGLKRYYVRMRVCERHLHAQAIVVNGVVSRFCQQCAKFQFVGEFAGSKKSCIATLERHNARHRAKVLARIQELNDVESDTAQTGGRSGRAKAKASSRRKGGKTAAAATAAVAPASASTSVRGGSTSVSAGGTERANSDTSGAGPTDGFWMPPAVATAQASGHGLGSAANLLDQRAQHSLSPGVPVPASPHPPKGIWDGASSAPVDLPPRPLVTTGGSGIVSTSERTAAAPPPPLTGGGEGPFVAPQQQQQQQLLPVPMSAGMPPSWLQQQYDVQRALAAVQNQVVMDGGPLGAPPTMTHAGECMDLVPRGMYVAGHGANDAAAAAWNHSPCATTAGMGIRAPSSQAAFMAPATTAIGTDAAAVAAVREGSAASPSSALYTSGSDASAGAKASHGTARQALQAVGDNGGSGAIFHGHGRHGFPAETTKSRGSSQSEPCGSTGRIAINAASPAYSADEGISATRVSASGAAFGTAAGGGGAGDASAPQQAGDVAARISSIMQELCPLIEQFKQEVAHGPVNPHDDVFAAAAPAAVATSGTAADAALAPGMETAVGVGSYTPGHSASFSPLVDTAMAMVQQASQLAASLRPTSMVATRSWTVTSGGPETQRQIAASGSMVPEPPLLGGPQGSGPCLETGPAHANSLVAALPQLQPQQLLQQQPHPPPMPMLLQPGWRPLVSHPGVVVNEAAVQQAASSIPGTGSGHLPATTSFPSPPAPGPGLLWAATPPPPATAMAPVLSPASSSAGHIVLGGYAGASAEADTTVACFGMGGASQLLSSAGAGFGTVPGIQGTKDDDNSEDDEMFQQLLTLLQDEAGDAYTMPPPPQQQKEQLLFQDIASTVHHAVAAHQQTLQAMPYGHAPTSPFYWPPMAAAPPPPQAPPQTSPPQPQPAQLQPHPSMPSPLSWLAAPVVPHHVEEPDDVDPRELTRVSLKAMNVLPHELPNNLRVNLRRWLKEARAEALQATLRPGCLQLVMDVLRQPSPSQELSSVLIPANDADQAAADVFRVLGQRLRDTYVQVDRRVLQMRVGERPVVLSWEEAAEEGGLDNAKYPVLRGCNAAAVCAGSQAILQLTGRHLSQSGIKVFARLLGHDLPTALLAPEDQPIISARLTDTDTTTNDVGDVSSLCLTVDVPPRAVGLMAVEVGVGHLLGDWWPVLVLPRGCEGAAEEVRRLQAVAEAVVQQRQAKGQSASVDAAHDAAGGAAGANAQAAGRAFRRLVRDMACVLEVFAAAAAADASADAIAAVARSSSSGGGGGGGNGNGSAMPYGAGGDAAPIGAYSPPSEGRCPLPNGGSSQVSRSDASLTAVSAASWSSGGRTDTLMSTNADSTLWSFMTTSSASAFMSAGMAPGQAHVQGLAAAQHTSRNPAAVAAAGSPGSATAAAVAAATVPLPVVILPPPSATMRQALSRAARLLRYAVARGMPYLTSLLLTVVNCLARLPSEPQSQPQSQPQLQVPSYRVQAQTVQVGPVSAGTAAAALPPPSSGPSRFEALAAAGVDLQVLLRLAVLSGSAPTVDQLAGFAVRVLGSPLRLDLPQGPGGLAALHLAALLPDGGALACHLLATQPWAAWQWLCLGWKPPLPLLEAASMGRESQQRQTPEARPQRASGALAATSGNSNGVVATKKELATGCKDEETSDKEDEVGWLWSPLPPQTPSFTPGKLSVILGNHVTVRKAASELMMTTKTKSGSGSGDGLWPGSSTTATLVTALEAWGRTGVALMEALCAQLAQQKLA